jgi:T5SS/PEP-CTERM-associated repeat protein
MKTRVVGFLISAYLCQGTVWAQTWPDFYLTNGTHLTSYGVEIYDPATVKNLYVNPTAILKPGGTELGNIYDGNQLYLNGGRIITSVIDEHDFTWNSGRVDLSGGMHTSTYGLTTGSGKVLHIWENTTVDMRSETSLPVSNHIYMGSIDMGPFGQGHDGGILRVNTFDASNLNMDRGGTLEISGILTGFGATSLKDYGNLVFTGADARWNTGGRLELGSYDGRASVTVNDGSVITSAGVITSVASIKSGVEVAGEGSQWISNGSIYLYGRQNNYLKIKAGGTVSAASLGLSSEDNGHTIEVSGNGSRLDLTGSLSIDANSIQGGGSSMYVTNGGVVTSAASRIGNRSGGNVVRVGGEGSQWIISGDLTIGIDNVANHLSIYDGGSVSCGDVIIGKESPHHATHGNSISVTGAGSSFNSSGHITVGAINNDINNLTVGDGGSVIAAGGLVVLQDGDNSYLNKINLNDGGHLTVGTDFDASMVGFNFNTGGTLSVEGQLTGLSSLESGRRLETPDLLGDLTVQGIFAPGTSPADSLLDGTLTVASDGTLEMELGGYAAGTEYDRLTVTGLASLDGLLDIVFLDSFSATNGASFDLFNWDGGVSGTFSAISTTALAAGQYWDTSELYTTGQLSVVPEPGSVGLLGLGSGILLFTRRHRRRRKADRFEIRLNKTVDRSCQLGTWTKTISSRF